jgi:hypothetical protein
MLDRIRLAAETTALWDAPWLTRVLSGWKYLGGEGPMRAWVARNTAADERLLRFLSLLTSVVTSSRQPEESLELLAESLREFFDLGELRERVDRIEAKPHSALTLRAVRRAVRSEDESSHNE